MACGFIKPDGTPCRFNAAVGAAFCAVHEAGAAEKLREARVRGGKQRHTGDTGQLDVTLATTESVRSILRNTVRKVRRNKMDPDRARVIVQACAVALRSIQVDAPTKAPDEAAGEDTLTDAQALAIVEAARNGLSKPTRGH